VQLDRFYTKGYGSVEQPMHAYSASNLPVTAIWNALSYARHARVYYRDALLGRAFNFRLGGKTVLGEATS
jgi:hypothetical protein